MARDVTARLLLTGELVTTTALHVGSGAPEVATDLPITTDDAGRPYLPGTGLAGAIRNWFRDRLPRGTSSDEGAALRALMGYAPERHERDDEGAASQLVVGDAFCLDENAWSELRDHVVIDPERGVAAAGLKYDRETVPPGTRFDFRLHVDAGNCEAFDVETVKSWLGALRSALEGGGIKLGGGASRGTGRVELRNARCRTQSLTDRAGVLAYLRERATPGAATPTPDEVWSSATLQEPARMTVEIAWRPVDGVLVRGAEEGEAADLLPLVTITPRGVAAVLPGSSVKGALRAYARKVVHTTGADPMLVDWLFGRGKRRKRENQHGKPPLENPALGRGALSIADVHTRKYMPADRWREIVEAADLKACAEAVAASPWGDQARAEAHGAIDRWTGGAADGRLFARLVPLELEWEPIRLEIDLARLREGPRDAVVALLLLVVRALRNGESRLGGQVNRGCGGIEITAMTLNANAAANTLAGLDGVQVNPEGFAGLDPAILQQLQKAWRGVMSGAGA